jgi:hypothetical protein
MWLGIAFLILAVVGTVLQAWLWGYPMEPDPGGPDPNGKSTAPRFWVQVHRVVGLAYVLIYVVMMWYMVPRLWEYQVELPARTVIHACVAIILGVLLVSKICIIRWFQHFGKALPGLGLGLLTCTIILGMLSLPFAIRAHGVTDGVFEAKNLSRVRMILGSLELGEQPDRTPEALTTESALMHGRHVLVRECAVCHDMRTVMVKPRTGASWHKLVKRMAAKPTLGPKIDSYDEAAVTSYLVAITPGLQESVSIKRREDRKRQEVKAAASAFDAEPTAADQGKELAQAENAKEPSAEEIKALVESRCTECHEMTDVDEYGGGDEAEWAKVVQRMIEEEDAELTAEEAKLIVTYLALHYPKS